MSVWNKNWRYTPSVQTDIRKLFKRIRAEQKDKEAQTRQIVRPIKQAQK